jgi:hypothetical protein
MELRSLSPVVPQTPVARLQWSRWNRCESSFSLLLVPDRPGIFAVSEEILAPGAAGKRLLALLLVSEAADLARDLNRLFTPASPMYERMSSGRCFIRFAVVDDEDERRAAASALKEWLVESAEVASGIPVDSPAAAPKRTEPATHAATDAKATADIKKDQPSALKPAFPAGF